MNVAHEAPFRILRDVEMGLPERALGFQRGKRVAVRIVLCRYDRAEVALMYSRRVGFYVLPGGGVSLLDTSLNDAASRELREEAGYSARLIRYLGVIEEHRGHWNHLERSHCILADVYGPRGTPQLTEHEQHMQFECRWFSYEEARRALLTNRTHPRGDTDLIFRFIAEREIAILERARAFIEHPLCPA